MTKDEEEKKELVNRIITGKLVEKEKTSTGIIEIDALLNGGLTVGTMTQIVGEISTGKTYIALQVASSFCKQDKRVLFIDTKDDVTSSMLHKMGIESYLGKSFFYICEPKFETVEKILDAFLTEENIDLIIDKENALGPVNVLSSRLKDYDDENILNLGVELYNLLSKDMIEESEELIKEFYKDNYSIDNELEEED